MAPSEQTRCRQKNERLGAKRGSRSRSPLFGRIQEAKQALAVERGSWREQFNDSSQSLELTDVMGHAGVRDKTDSHKELSLRIQEAKEAIKAEKERCLQFQESDMNVSSKPKHAEPPPPIQPRRISFSGSKCLGNSISMLGDRFKMAKDALENNFGHRSCTESDSGEFFDSCLGYDSDDVRFPVSELEPQMDMRKQAMASSLKGRGSGENKNKSKEDKKKSDTRRKQMDNHQASRNKSRDRANGSSLNSIERSISPSIRNNNRRGRPPPSPSRSSPRLLVKKCLGTDSSGFNGRSCSPAARSKSRGRNVPNNKNLKEIRPARPKNSRAIDERRSLRKQSLQKSFKSLRNICDRGQSKDQPYRKTEKKRTLTSGQSKSRLAYDDMDLHRRLTKVKSMSRRRLPVHKTSSIKCFSDDEADTLDGNKSFSFGNDITGNHFFFQAQSDFDFDAENMLSYNSKSDEGAPPRPPRSRVRDVFDAAIGALGISYQDEEHDGDDDDDDDDDEYGALTEKGQKMRAIVRVEEDALKELKKFKAAIRKAGFVTSGGAYCVLNDNVSALATKGKRAKPS